MSVAKVARMQVCVCVCVCVTDTECLCMHERERIRGVYGDVPPRIAMPWRLP